VSNVANGLLPKDCYLFQNGKFCHSVFSFPLVGLFNASGKLKNYHPHNFSLLLYVVSTGCCIWSRVSVFRSLAWLSRGSIVFSSSVIRSAHCYYTGNHLKRRKTSQESFVLAVKFNLFRAQKSQTVRQTVRTAFAQSNGEKLDQPFPPKGWMTATSLRSIEVSR
jgi:hypothetical protein